ncbi:MAG: ABC transporter substrate-binding protein [Desulfitobacteriaceae bacterium]
MQRKTGKVLSLVIAIVLVVSLSGCGSNGSSSGAAADKAPIRIGQATALTSEYTVVGQYLTNGTKMAVDEINAAGGISGRKIQLVQEDSANTNPAAVNAINKLIDSDNVIAIMGPDLSTQDFAVAPIINKAKIPFTVQGTNAKLLDGNPWFFRLRPDDGLAARTAAKFAIEGLKKKKIAVTHDSDEFGVGGRDLIVKAVQDLGGTVVDEESYNSNDKDLTAILTNIKNKGAEVIIDWGHPSQSATLQRQNKQLGLNLPIIGSPGMGMPATIQLAGDAANGTYIVGDPVPGLNTDPKVQAWVKKYTDLYKAAPDFHAASAYDGIYMLKMAIEKAGSTDASAIQKALLTIKDYPGMGNTFTFTDGNGAHMVMITQIENGKNNKLIQSIKF